jgi:hypothetical protein
MPVHRKLAISVGCATSYLFINHYLYTIQNMYEYSV